jgi:hypothetical protein
MSLAAIAVAAVLLSSAQDGHWKGQLEGGEHAAKVSFQVKRDGRRITGFSTTVSAFCVGPTIGTNRFAILVVSVPSAKVRRNGRFKRTYKTDGGGTYKIRGTLRGRRVRDGHVSLQVSTCSGQSLWTARRTGR